MARRPARPAGAGTRILSPRLLARAEALAPELAAPPPGLPTPDALAAERGGYAAWCGPAVVAMAAGIPYEDACGLLRRLAPACYPAEGDIVTAYWRDLVAALGEAGVPVRPLRLPRTGPGRTPTLIGLVRDGNLAPGWYLVRVTGHFLLLRAHGFGLAQVFDNRIAGAVLSARAHGRCRVTHAARLLGGPLAAADG